MKTTQPIKKSEKTRLFIIEKCAPVFNKKGVAGTTLSDLTEATGLTKGSIYGNFKDKHDVALAAFQYNADFLISYISNRISKQETYLKKLLAIPEAYRRLYKQMVAFGGCPIGNALTEADDTLPELRQLATQTIKQMTLMVTEMLEKGKQKGEFQPLIDAGKTAEIIISLIEGSTIISKATEQKSYQMNSLDMVEYLIHSITPPI